MRRQEGYSATLCYFWHNTRNLWYFLKVKYRDLTVIWVACLPKKKLKKSLDTTVSAGLFSSHYGHTYYISERILILFHIVSGNYKGAQMYLQKFYSRVALTVCRNGQRIFAAKKTKRKQLKKNSIRTCFHW